MNDAVLVAILSLVGTLSGSWMGVRQSNRLMNYRMDKLEAKVDRHNQLVERMALVEQSAKSAHHRIDDMKDTLKKEKEGIVS